MGLCGMAGQPSPDYVMLASCQIKTKSISIYNAYQHRATLISPTIFSILWIYDSNAGMFDLYVVA